jgi:hypothetical protein
VFPEIGSQGSYYIIMSSGIGTVILYYIKGY